MKITKELLKAQEELILTCKMLEESCERHRKTHEAIMHTLAENRIKLNEMLEDEYGTQEEKN